MGIESDRRNKEAIKPEPAPPTDNQGGTGGKDDSGGERNSTDLSKASMPSGFRETQPKPHDDGASKAENQGDKSGGEKPKDQKEVTTPAVDRDAIRKQNMDNAAEGRQGYVEQVGRPRDRAAAEQRSMEEGFVNGTTSIRLSGDAQ